MQRPVSKNRITFIGLLFIAYFSLLACKNTQLFLYGGTAILCGSIVLDKLLSKDRMRFVFPKGCKWLYYFVVYCFFSRIWAWETHYVTNLSKFLIAIFIVTFLCVNYFIKTRNLNTIIAAVAMVGISLSCYVIIKEGGLTAFYHAATRSNERIGGSITNVNNIGMAGAISTVILLYYGIFQKKRSFLLLLIIPFMAAAASGSRKSILLLIAGVFITIFLSQKNKSGAIKFIKIILGLCIAFIALKIIMSLEIMSTVNERWESLFASFSGDMRNADGSALTRKKMMSVGWEQFLKTPFLGIGLGNSVMLNGQKLGLWVYSHLDYIEQLVNGGIIGLLLYYGNIISLAVKHWKLMKIRKDSELIISFTILLLYIIMSAACITYYGSMETYLYFILWISVTEVKRVEFLEEGLLNENKYRGGYR